MTSKSSGPMHGQYWILNTDKSNNQWAMILLILFTFLTTLYIFLTGSYLSSEVLVEKYMGR